MSRAALAVACCLLTTSVAHADPIDDVVLSEMAKRKIPGLSLAVVQGGKLVKVQGYGVVRAGEPAPVTPKTLFQAGSISKAVAAVGALHLVEKKQLALDEDVNLLLKSWKVPESDLTKTEKVTLRRLVSHSAGLTVHGFPGYPAGGPVPTLVQVLDGQPPANTAPIRVDLVPGSKWRYSGGGYTVMQQLLIDVSGQPFPALLKRIVLGPAGMIDSSFEQPLPPAWVARTAIAHDSRRKPIAARHHIYPEMAAAGLWTTAGDLARFGMEMQRSLAGRSKKIVSQKQAREMVTVQKEASGLGVFLGGKDRGLTFSHGGRDEGFDAFWIATVETGQGLAIMINTNDNSAAVRRIADAVAREYGWPDAKPLPKLETYAASRAELEALAGRYELSNNNMIALLVAPEGDRLYSLADGLPDEELLPIGPGRFATRTSGLVAEIVREGTEVVGFSWTRGEKEKGKAPRLLPLLGNAAPAKDPDPALTARALAAVKALGNGTTGDPSLAITPGARKVFTNLKFPPIAAFRSLTYLMSADVTGRGLERHEHKVTRVLAYEMVPRGERRYLLVHLTAAGLVADFDLVDE